MKRAVLILSGRTGRRLCMRGQVLNITEGIVAREKSSGNGVVLIVEDDDAVRET